LNAVRMRAGAEMKDFCKASYIQPWMRRNVCVSARLFCECLGVVQKRHEAYRAFQAALNAYVNV